MAVYLERGKQEEFPAADAIKIIQLVQLRGCSLHGTSAQRALEGFLAQEPKDSNNSYLAEITLKAIQNDSSFPQGPDTLKGGPCKTGEKDSKGR